MTPNQQFSHISGLVLKGVALAMGVATVITGILGVMELKGQILLLGIGLFCLALNALDKE